MFPTLWRSNPSFATFYLSKVVEYVLWNSELCKMYKVRLLGRIWLTKYLVHFGLLCIRL